MDAASRRPQLPALSYLDIDKGKLEEEAYQDRNTGAPQSYNRASAASPPYQHPKGPPPPYSHAASQQTNSWSGVKSEAHPSESRRTSGEEYETAKQMSRQSLPSISEALGVDGQTSYPSSTPAVQAPSQPAAASSPSPSARRSYGMETSQFQNAYGNGTTSQYRSFRQDSAGPHSCPPPDASKPAYAPSQDSRQDFRPPLHVQTSQPSRTERQEKQSYQRAASPPYEQSSSQSAGPMGPPSFPYGYAPYPPRYAEPTPPSSHSSGPIYQPSAQYAPPSHTISSTWRSENASSRFAPDDRSPTSRTYGESVKRHLDLYDLEAALNDISQTSSIVLDFSRRYGDRMHQTARAGPSLSTLPGAVEVEDMINKSRLQLDSLNKIREVIIAHQVAYEQQVADQRHQVKTFREPPPQIAERHGEGEESKGGFAGSETKKRRGRAAPPGRCHSCNRAETPEWRRGPDGARTLCNACGLHYAKLTRKQTNANKTANVASSNLRPKES